MMIAWRTSYLRESLSSGRWSYWLIPLQLLHQVGEAPVWSHQLSIRADKTVGEIPHASKKAIFEDPVRLIHEVGQLDGEVVDASNIAVNGRDLGYHNGLRVLGMHLFQVLDAGIAIGTVIMQAQEVRWLIMDAAHEISQPVFAVLV